MNEVVFKVEHQQVLGTILEGFPQAVVSQWCSNGERDIFEVRVDDEASMRKLEQKIKSLPSVLVYHVDANDNVIIVVRKCECYEPGAIAKLITESSCLLMPPIIYHKGWEHYKIVSFTPKGETHLFDTLEPLVDLEILSKTRIVNAGTGGGVRISILSLFSRMTNRQLHALLTAYESGYYRTPRRITTEELAKKMQVTRPTFEEHQRKAENKIVAAIAPYLRLLFYRKPLKGSRTNRRSNI